MPPEAAPAPDGSVLVTGGSRGIGRAVALRLATQGRPVGVLSRTGGEEAEATVAAIEAAGHLALSLKADVADSAQVEQAFDRLEQAHGPVLVLVNNAGLLRDNISLRLKDADWEEVLATNLTGAFWCARRALRGMLRARWGRIVNVSSVVASRANPGQANYIASKAGLEGLTATLAKEVGRKGITVNAVAPGLVETDMTAGTGEALLPFVPAGRVGRPEEVAACVAFLCSDEAAYVNGATLPVDGGLGA